MQSRHRSPPVLQRSPSPSSRALHITLHAMLWCGAVPELQLSSPWLPRAPAGLSCGRLEAFMLCSLFTAGARVTVQRTAGHVWNTDSEIEDRLQYSYSLCTAFYKYSIGNLFETTDTKETAWPAWRGREGWPRPPPRPPGTRAGRGRPGLGRAEQTLATAPSSCPPAPRKVTFIFKSS